MQKMKTSQDHSKEKLRSVDCKDYRTKSMSVIGLQNLWNTCYLNSVLQNLLYLRPFRDQLHHTMNRTEYKLVPKKHPELETLTFAYSGKKTQPGKLTKELFKLINETTSLRTATPGPVRNEIVGKSGKFSDGTQQDSHELFRFLIDMVKDEEIQRLKEAFFDHFDINDHRINLKNYPEDRMKLLRKYASEFGKKIVFTGTFIDDIFEGKMISTVKCEGCGNILYVNEDFLDISLPLPEYSQEYNILSSNPPQSEIEPNSGEEVKVKSKELKILNKMPNDYLKDSLEYYLMRFFSPIFLEEEYVCNNCNPQLISKQDDTSDTSSNENDDTDSIDYDALKFTSAVKQFHIKTVGPVLTIHLKRFSQTAYGLQKLNKRVDFPLVLDMSPFCVSDTSVFKDYNNQILYGLRGIVDHSDEMSGGRYVAYVNIADWNVPYKISSSDSAKSRIAGKSNEKINSTEQPMNTDPAQENRMPLASENSKCGPVFQPTPPLTSSSLLKHVIPTEEWYHISDSHVSRTDHSQVFSSQAYMLFYERLPLVTKDTHVL